MRWLLLLLISASIPSLLGQEISKEEARLVSNYNELKNTSAEKAEVFLTDALKKNESPFLRYELGLLYASKSKNTEAIEAFQKVLQSRSEFPGAERNLAILLAKEKRHPEAIQVLTKLAKRRDLGAELNLLLGEAYSIEANHYAALQCFNAALPAFPDEMDLRLKIAESLYKLKRYNEADAAATAVTRKNAAIPSAWVIRGNCYLKSGDLKRAVDCFEAARLLDVDLGRKLLPTLANIYLSLNMPKMAAECFSQSGATAVPQQVALARAFYSDGEFEQAEAVLKQIPAGEEQPKEAHLLRALLKAQSGDLKTAESLLSAHIQAYPLDGEALVTLASIASRQGRTAEAISWYRSARQSDTWKRYAMESELDLHLQSGNDESALLLLSELKLLFPSPQWDELERQLR